MSNVLEASLLDLYYTVNKGNKPTYRQICSH